MRGGNSGRGQLLLAMQNSRKRRANRACVRSAKRTAAGGYSRGPGAFRIAASACVCRILAAGCCMFHRYNPHCGHFRCGCVFFSVNFREAASSHATFADCHPATRAPCDCAPSFTWVPLLYPVRGFELAGYPRQANSEALRHGLERAAHHISARIAP